LPGRCSLPNGRRKAAHEDGDTGEDGIEEIEGPRCANAHEVGTRKGTGTGKAVTSLGAYALRDSNSLDLWLLQVDHLGARIPAFRARELSFLQTSSLHPDGQCHRSCPWQVPEIHICCLAEQI